MEELPATLNKHDIEVFKLALKSGKVEEIENDTAAYVKDVFNIVRKRADFLDLLEAEVLNRLGDLTAAQLIALVSNTTVNTNDAINKALAPTAQILTEKQRAEAAKANAMAAAGTAVAQANTIQAINSGAPQDVLIGMKGLADLLAAAAQNKHRDE